ncbi:unnamed protein product [Absidia cylindrospora]
MVKNDLLKELNVSGDTQDMLDYIGGNKNICLVILVYAGLSTNYQDLERILRENENVDKIIVANDQGVYGDLDLFRLVGNMLLMWSSDFRWIQVVIQRFWIWNG